MSAPLWKPGDRVRFAHQHPDGEVRTVKRVIIQPIADRSPGNDHSMVEIEALPGQFADYIFVRAQ